MPPFKNKPFLSVLIRAVAEAYVEYLREGGDPKDIKAFTVHAKNVIGAILHRT